MKNLLLLFIAIISFSACDKEASTSNSSTSINLVGTKWIVQIIETTDSDDIYEVNTLTDGTSDLYMLYENFTGFVNYSEIEFLDLFTIKTNSTELPIEIDGNIIRLFDGYDEIYHTGDIEYYLEDNNLIFLYENLKVTHYPVD